MLFNSFHYLIFLPIVVLLYFSTPFKWRWVILLAASYYFYASAQPQYLVLMFAISTVSYLCGIWVGRDRTPEGKLQHLLLCLFFCLGVLFLFKYYGFTSSILSGVLGSLGFPIEFPVFALALPLGISFHTFQALSYVIDVYHGTRAPELHFGKFTLFLSFFPQLVAGPIERSDRLLPQFSIEKTFDSERTFSSIRLIFWGLFKKVVIADNLALPVATVYGNPSEFSALTVLVASVLFLIQIYADFSGYTDIARGSARMLGYELSLNFRRPFAARSISDFWARWHISLTSWFQDYVFTPLYRRLSHGTLLLKLPFYQRHFVAFGIATIIGLTLLGLWHGAGVNFILFGLSQAFAIICYHLVRKWWNRLPYLIANMGTLCFVLVGFIFFRAHSVSDALYIISSIPLGVVEGVRNLVHIGFYAQLFSGIGFTATSLMVVLGSIVIMEIVEFGKEREIFYPRRLPQSLVWVGYYTILFLIVLYGYVGHQPFIYFQF